MFPDSEFVKKIKEKILIMVVSKSYRRKMENGSKVSRLLYFFVRNGFGVLNLVLEELTRPAKKWSYFRALYFKKLFQSAFSCTNGTKQCISCQKILILNGSESSAQSKTETKRLFNHLYPRFQIFFVWNGFGCLNIVLEELKGPPLPKEMAVFPGRVFPENISGCVQL